MNDKDNRTTVSITMNSMPLNVYKEFTQDIQKYNGTYWVKLLELMRKAQAYDYWIQMGNQQDEYEEVEQPEQEEKEERITFKD